MTEIASCAPRQRGRHNQLGFAYQVAFVRVQPMPAAATSATRARLKHIGGYFDPRTSTQLRYLAVTENSSVQALLAEAIGLLFQARGLTTRDE